MILPSPLGTHSTGQNNPLIAEKFTMVLGFPCPAPRSLPAFISRKRAGRAIARPDATRPAYRQAGTGRPQASFARPRQGPATPPPSAGAIARRYTVPPNGAAPFPPPNPAAVHRAARNRAAQRGGLQRTPIGVPKNRPPMPGRRRLAAPECRRIRRFLQGRPSGVPCGIPSGMPLRLPRRRAG